MPASEPHPATATTAAAAASAEFAALNAEFWLYASRNPGAMKLLATKLGEQDEALEPAIAAAMHHLGTPPGISAAEMALLPASRMYDFG